MKKTIKILKLRDIQPDELHELYRRNRSRLRDYFPESVEHTTEEDSTIAYLQRLAQLENTGKRACIGLSVNQKLIGLLYVLKLDQAKRTCELAYFIDLEWTGKGMASTLVNEGLRFCNTEYNIREFNLRIDPGNKSSAGVANKCGFKEYGREKDAFVLANGQKVDLILYKKVI